MSGYKKLHPTFFATCALLKKTPSEVILEAHRWAEKMPTQEEWNELRKIHIFRGQMTAIVHAFCIATLTGHAEPIEPPNQLPPHLGN